jgi:hypothetical protein
MSKTFKKNEPGAPSVSLSVLEDGSLALQFSRPIQAIGLNIEDAKQLALNLVAAATVAQQQLDKTGLLTGVRRPS